jgi:hypothetical protein
MADTSWDSYTYLPGKIIHKTVYTDGYSPVHYDSLQYAYYYDAQGRLLRYENEYISDQSAFVYETEKMIVNYSGDKISSVSWQNFDGNEAIHQFEYSTDMRQLTIYDTLNTDPNELDQKYIYYFNSDQTVDSTIFITMAIIGGLPVTDSIYSKFVYGTPGNLARYIEYNYSSFMQNFNIETTEVLQRETQGAEIGKTLRKIRSSLDFYHQMHLQSNDALSFFDMALPANTIFSPFPPVNLRAILNAEPPQNGTVVNVFDSRNLLVEQTFPNPFGSKIEGPSKLTYTYVRVAD